MGLEDYNAKQLRMIEKHRIHLQKQSDNQFCRDFEKASWKEKVGMRRHKVSMDEAAADWCRINSQDEHHHKDGTHSLAERFRDNNELDV